MAERNGTIGIAVIDGREYLRRSLCIRLALEEDLEVLVDAADEDNVAEMFRQHRPDVLILGPGVPILQGPNTILRVAHWSPRTRVIVAVDPADHSRRRELERLGAFPLAGVTEPASLINEIHAVCPGHPMRARHGVRSVWPRRHRNPLVFLAEGFRAWQLLTSSGGAR